MYHRWPDACCVHCRSRPSHFRSAAAGSSMATGSHTRCSTTLATTPTTSSGNVPTPCDEFSCPSPPHWCSSSSTTGTCVGEWINTPLSRQTTVCILEHHVTHCDKLLYKALNSNSAQLSDLHWRYVHTTYLCTVPRVDKDHSWQFIPRGGPTCVHESLQMLVYLAVCYHVTAMTSMHWTCSDSCIHVGPPLVYTHACLSDCFFTWISPIHAQGVPPPPPPPPPAELLWQCN